MEGKLSTVTQEAKAHQHKIRIEEDNIRKEEAVLASPEEDKKALRDELDTKLKAQVRTMAQ